MEHAILDTIAQLVRVLGMTHLIPALLVRIVLVEIRFPWIALVVSTRH
jgi:hypothetical protein